MNKLAIALTTLTVGGVSVLAMSGNGAGTHSALEAESGVSRVVVEHERTHGVGEPTLWGIYGHHDVHDCPLNNKEIAEYVVRASRSDLGPLFNGQSCTS